MSDEEDYSSSDDEDYVPSDGEAVSEEENSGEEENLDALREDGGGQVSPVKRKRKAAKLEPRKRKGGIQLEGAEGEATQTEDTANKALEEQIAQEKVEKKELQEKKRADDLWSSFMTDVGKRPPKKTAEATGTSSSLASLSKPLPSSSKHTSSSPSIPTSESKITVTKVYDFAGEAVKVTKELDVNSKEGKAELKRQQEEKEMETKPDKAASKPGLTGMAKKPGAAGLGGLLDKINKKPKIGTLEKSRLDWDSFKDKEGISEELKIHNRGKSSYIERMNFLQRSDQRQFELERDLRLSTSKR